MSSKVLYISNLPFGTKPNTVYAQFHDEKYYQNILDIYTHADHKGQAWVIFSSDVAPNEHEKRRLFGEGQNYYAYVSCPKDIPFDIASCSTKVERYTDFVAKKDKEEEIKGKGMHKVYHVTARFVDDVYSEEEVKDMQDDCSDGKYLVI